MYPILPSETNHSFHENATPIYGFNSSKSNIPLSDYVSIEHLWSMDQDKKNEAKKTIFSIDNLNGWN